MGEDARHPVKALEKTVAIVETLQETGPAHLREIASELDMNKSTVHNHLSTLREHEYVVKDGDTYELSLRFLTIGGVLRDDIELLEAAQPKIDDLAAKTGELVTLATVERGIGVVLYRAAGENAVEIDTHIGAQVPLHNSALGKAILGHMPAERVEEIIAERGLPGETPNTITERETLQAELETVADRGWAYDDEERWRGLRCVAAPILADDGDVKGAVSLSIPRSRMATEEKRTMYADEVENTANLIELSLTYS
jgi:DNA-binding IclR family transcriptional regulator